MHTLQRVGLALSDVEKTVILLASSGTSASSVVVFFLRIIEGETFLRIPVGRTRLLFKVVSTCYASTPPRHLARTPALQACRKSGKDDLSCVHTSTLGPTYPIKALKC